MQEEGETARLVVKILRFEKSCKDSAVSPTGTDQKTRKITQKAEGKRLYENI